MTLAPYSGSARLRPRARLIGLIGEELISDEPVAVVELVKNAYDADATNVEVRFEGRSIGRPDRIIVMDDGSGMTLETVLSSWFEPGTVAKRAGSSSPGGRPYQGAKGIGRFAASRLARSMLMETKGRSDSYGVIALFDWGRFDDESYLDEISIDYDVGPVTSLSHGTRLTLEGVRKPWSDADYRILHARLSRLISPFQEVHDFRIRLEVPGLPDISGMVAPPEIVLRPRYELRGELDIDGSFAGEIRVDGALHRLFPHWPIKSRAGNPECGPFGVDIRAWDRDREGLEPFAESLSLSITEIRRTLDQYCGVSIYRNGFRVHPYGERGNDWLGLDRKSRQNPVQSLANNQIIAAIRISRERNPDLRDRSNREGMVINAAHRALEDWFSEILALLEAERYKLRPRKPSDRAGEPLFEPFDISPAVERASSELGPSHPITVMIKEDDRRLKEGVERVQETLSRMLLAAGLGQMVDVVLHEIGSPLGKVNRKLEVVQRELGSRLAPADLAVMGPMILDIEGWLEQIQTLRQRLDPQTAGKRGRASTFSIEDEFKDNFDLYQALLDRQGITHTIEITDGPVIVTMPRAALGQIVSNLIDNSIYWLHRTRGSGKGGRIAVEAGPLPTGFRVLFSDDGPGVLQQDRAHIFEPYFTQKPNGIGLGLYISRFLVEPYGTLNYVDECHLHGACFEICFEHGVGR